MKLFSQRKRIKENKDIYEYNYIPDGFVNSLRSTMQSLYPPDYVQHTLVHGYQQCGSTQWHSIKNILIEEGGYSFSFNPEKSSFYEIEKLLLSEISDSYLYKQQCNFLLDLLETFIFFLNEEEKASFISLLNNRFREYGLGYQYEDGYGIVQISDTHIFKETIQPALEILRNPIYEKVNENYREAFKHLQNSHYKDCITACGRAVESLLRAFCASKNWQPTDYTLSKLLNCVSENGLFPEDLKGTLSSFVQTIGSIRNKAGAHGSDFSTENPPLYLAEYVLHLTASNIIFLHKSSENYAPTITSRL